MLNDLVAPHYAWLEQEVLPGVTAIYKEIDFASWEEYTESFQQCSADLIKSSQSTGKFLYLTFRPLCQVLLIFGYWLWGISRILFKLLLEQGLISLQKGAIQAKTAIIWFYLFQRNLTRTEILGEIGLVVLVISGYYLRKWLKKQTYWERITKWITERKKKVYKVRLARPSLFDFFPFCHYGRWASFFLDLSRLCVLPSRT
jgi:hypothetical protein